MNKNSEFFRAYVETAIWADLREADGEPLDHAYDLDDLAPETQSEWIAECEDFCSNRIVRHAIATYGDARVARDFWLTRNRHGAGYWDGDYAPARLGTLLTDISQVYGSIDLYIGDNELIYSN